ncbi:G-type lectin S-receptor-like serine/threonine-protein kinase LECRK1 [Humulus lupulus]|uniref:G-type lectin S-receptor-like serine/threonine-protein kinase LECRK1 n=1 Tax=Humulus lupulus TaxID=3486 RepID=UPI002B416F5E|nr:G-type lectin S-receptor-like serine/threonine-protein kinase LECRK1 [Humulus lupulus]
MAYLSIVFMLLSASAISFPFLVSADNETIALGASLVPVATTSRDQHSVWSSPSGYFSFGFYPFRQGYAIGIWLVGAEENTTVWTANRNNAPILASSSPKLVLERFKLVLITADGPEILVANSSVPVSSASMLDNGNFVLYDKNHKITWQSFDHPTDTILQGQYLTAGARLFSNKSTSDPGEGDFFLIMQTDGNLVLYAKKYMVRVQDAYWASDTRVEELIGYELYLNETGLLAVVQLNESPVILPLNKEYNSYDSPEKNVVTIYRATLDVDGSFRLYSHRRGETEGFKESNLWSSIINPCNVHGYCGLNSYCTIFDAASTCKCIPGTGYSYSENEKAIDCLRKYQWRGCKDGGEENTTSYTMEEMENIVWGSDPYDEGQMSSNHCKNQCLEDCNCGMAHYEKSSANCRKYQLPLVYVRRDFSQSTTAFFKVGKTVSSNNTVEKTPKPRNQGVTNRNMVQILVLVLGLTVFSFVALAIFGMYAFKIRDLRYKRLRDIGNLSMVGDQLTLRVFSYNDLKRATNGFKEVLGKGSFGTVYKGTLNRGRKLVAVKRLEKLVEEGETEFLSEMRAIGRANHKNIVRLLGYCAQGSKRLLVYEFMSYGSLANIIFNNESKRLDWKDRVRIAIEVARGILYLHEECRTPIIHCDIKPQNILMDDFWTAKISDFGLAKLLMPDQTRTMTRVRGTRGYLAPEWQKNFPISVKTDVYSYGIVLLEIICCRSNLEVNVEDTDEIVLASWVYKCFSSMELDKLVIGEEVDKKTLENMVKVGLWCIQDDPTLRPSMKSVVLMLEGITEISVPPCPTYSPNFM